MKLKSNIHDNARQFALSLCRALVNSAFALSVRLKSMKYIFIFTVVFLIGCTAHEVQPDPIYRETQIRNDRPKLNSEIFDVNERNELLKLQFSEADKIAERRVSDVERDGQFIKAFWAAKKVVLSERFGIEWKSPAELNPSLCYLNYGQPCITVEEANELTALVSEKKYASQSIQGIYRDLYGYVYLGACNSEKSECGQYKYYGHDKEWQYLGYSIIEE